MTEYEVFSMDFHVPERRAVTIKTVSHELAAERFVDSRLRGREPVESDDSTVFVRVKGEDDDAYIAFDVCAEGAFDCGAFGYTYSVERTSE